ncbi:hypothetical protein HID58_087856 [Brassica napus]|uniref:Uncharacterized protein n=1 Tax=Brassica napus TaxID=3708 RepID=A0ABQ7XUG6_BRANA|nr:hypothetical protein HID58_087856 [Brassica napus]
MSNSPSSKTTSHDSIIPQTSTPWRLSKAISAQQMTSLPSCFLGNKRAIFFSPHSAALDHFDWAVSTAKHSSKPLTTLQQLRFGSNALKTFHATPQSSTSRSPPLAFLWCINKRIYGRKRSDDDQAVTAVDFLVEDVETAVTRVAVAEESIDTVFGDAQLRSPLVELSRGNEFPEQNPTDSTYTLFTHFQVQTSPSSDIPLSDILSSDISFQAIITKSESLGS